MSLVKNIKTLCERENIRLEQLSKELGWGENSIYRWDKNSPSVDKIQKVAERFKVTIDSLLAENFVLDVTVSNKENLKNFIDSKENDPYIILSAKAKEKGMPLDVLEKLIEFYTDKKETI